MGPAPVTGASIPDRLLVPGRNCWRLDDARRVRFLVDGASYFSALADALDNAEHRVLILGWDIHGGTRLLPSDGSENVDALGPFLRRVLSRRPELQVNILTWDFSVLFALEREWTPLFSNNSWIEHPRLDFRFDDRHPPGGSHHQKVVVVDDAIAFVGGFDLTQRRWDTPEHRVDDRRRLDSDGRPYGPVHDVQALVDGRAAAALGELTRERWSRATGRNVPAVEVADSDPWPENLSPDIENVPVAISRTWPAWDGSAAAREVEQLYLDAIGAARKLIYVENQYFTSSAIADALERRLREPAGPEILMVLPRDCSGWLEEGTMGALRNRNLHRLHRVDENRRFHVCYPIVSGDCSVHVHSKVLVVDDQLARVGSSNLSNRSLGLDSECDIAVEAQGSDAVAASIASFRNRLLAEHLEADEGDVRSTLHADAPVTALLERLGKGERTLRRIEPEVGGWDVFVPDETIVDPRCPEMPKRFLREFVSEDVTEATKHPWIRVLVVLAILLGLAAIWRWTPLTGWIEPEIIASWADGLRGHPLAAVIVTAIYVVAGLLMLPVTGLILATALTFEPWAAIGYSLLGSVVSGLSGFAIGHVLARDTVRRLAGSRLNRVSKLLGRGGVIAVIALRILPVAPFTVANIIAGASHIRWRDFTLGTALGLAPGIVIINVFKNQAETAIREPGPGSVLVLAGFLTLVVLGIAWARRTLKVLATEEV